MRRHGPRPKSLCEAPGDAATLEGWGDMQETDSNLILPFAVIERESGSAEEFPFDMTLATILADVEKQREKAGMLRKREEGLEFASLLYWPIIVAPWREGRNLVFDGMGVWSYVFAQGKIPDAAKSASFFRTIAWRSRSFGCIADHRASRSRSRRTTFAWTSGRIASIFAP